MHVQYCNVHSNPASGLISPSPQFDYNDHHDVCSLLLVESHTINFSPCLQILYLPLLQVDDSLRAAAAADNHDNHSSPFHKSIIPQMSQLSKMKIFSKKYYQLKNHKNKCSLSDLLQRFDLSLYLVYI